METVRVTDRHGIERAWDVVTDKFRHTQRDDVLLP